MASLMSEVQRDAFVRRVRLEMAKGNLTREGLSQQAACKERTLGNLLAGQPVRDATVAKIARVLGIDLEDFLDGRGTAHAAEAMPADEGRAAEEYGGYLLSSYAHYIGTYFAYRRVLSDKTEFFRSIYEIDWDDEQRRLRFFELQRFRTARDTTVSSTHAGGVHISPHTGIVHFLTTYQGALRLVTLNKFRTGDTRLKGLILTQSDRDVFFQPAVSAIYLEKIRGKRKNSELEQLAGAFGRDDPEFEAVAREIAAIERDAVFIAGHR
jgi:transcriptional regulator with XRE-family HTH domain